MPQEWKDLAKRIGTALKRQGKDAKDAEREGYAVATNIYKRKHGGMTPQSADPKKK